MKLLQTMFVVAMHAIACSHALASGWNNTIVRRTIDSFSSGPYICYAYVSTTGESYAFAIDSKIKRILPSIYTYEPSYSGPCTLTNDALITNRALLSLPAINMGPPAVQIQMDAPADTATTATPVTQQMISYTSISIARPVANKGVGNTSNRCRLEPGATGTLGLVVTGETRVFIIRAVGASLNQFGLNSVIDAPQVRVFDSRSVNIISGRQWNEKPDVVPMMTELFSMVGAFPLTKASSEQVVIWPFTQGNYTIQYTNTGSTAGECLIEVYALPFAFQ